MSVLSVQGILNTLAIASEQRVVLVPVLREVFINETPLFARLPHEHVGAADYSIISYDVRQRPLTLSAAITAVPALTTATVTFGDVSQLQQGDVIEIYSSPATGFERAEVVADPVVPNQVSLLRGVEGTTPVANDLTTQSALTCYLIGNSRTGGEVNQTASRAARTLTQQYVQTYQFPVQVAGLTEAIEAIALPPGMTGVFNMESSTKMREFVRDVEFTGMYGVGQAASVANATMRRKQVGLRKQIANYKGGINYKAAAGTSYTKQQFVADGIQRVLNAGGNPDTILMGVDWESGLSTWVLPQQQTSPARTTREMGVRIEEWLTSFGGRPLKIVSSFQMLPGTAAVLTSSDLKFRYVREAFFQKRGIRGDAWEGDYIGDYCIEAGHPGWHAWIEGVKTWA